MRDQENRGQKAAVPTRPACGKGEEGEMNALIPAVIGGLLLAAVIYEIVRLITPGESRLPSLARLRGRRAALEGAERWCAGLRMHGRIDAVSYQRRMSSLAHGKRRPTRHEGL